MTRSANAVVAKAHAIYGQMLTPAQYTELLHKQSVPEISAYLREKTSYALALEGVQDSTVHRGQLENLLRKDLLLQYARLSRYASPRDGVYSYVVLDMEIEVILASLRGLISGREDELLASLPAFVGDYAGFDVFALARARSLEEIMEVVKDTPYAPLLRDCMERYPAREGGQPRYTRYERALRGWYFAQLLRRTEKTTRGKAAKQLQEMICTRAELLNLGMIFRMKAFFEVDTDRIREALLPYSWHIRPRMMQTLVEANGVQEFLQLLQKTPYGRRIPSDTDAIEPETDSIRYRLCKRMFHFSTDPQVVFMAFMLLREMETQDIIRIIEGVRYQLPPERIEKLLYKS